MRSSLITPDGADCAALATAAGTFRGLLSEGALVRCGEGERSKEEQVGDFRQATKWLIVGGEHRRLGRARMPG